MGGIRLVVVEEDLQVGERGVRAPDQLDHLQEVGLVVDREPPRDDGVAGEGEGHLPGVSVPGDRGPGVPDPSVLGHEAWGAGEGPHTRHERDQGPSVPRGRLHLRRAHRSAASTGAPRNSRRGHSAQRPRVKSGTSTGRERFSTDHSVSGQITESMAAS